MKRATETEMGVGSPVASWHRYSVFVEVWNTRCSEDVVVVPFTQNHATNEQHLPVEPHYLNDLPVLAFL